jgi:hypothetical protein
VSQRVVSVACLALAALLALGGAAGVRAGDLSVGRAVEIPVGTRAQGQVVVGAPLVIDGSIDGDVIAIGGDLTIRGEVRGDVLAVGGHLRVEGAGIVRGDALAVGGSLDISDGGRVEGEARAVHPSARRMGLLALGLSPLAFLLRLLSVLAWTLLALVFAFAAPRVLVHASAEIGRRPLRLMGIGLLWHACLLLTFVLCVALVVVFVGLPLLVLLVLVAALVKAAALGAAFHSIGSFVAERIGGDHASGYARLLLGAALLGALRLIPFAGLVPWLLAQLLGAGAILATWRRHRPEMLAVR